MPSVNFEHITKRFGDTTVVQDFNLEVHDGELLVLVGGSGSGKSTILRMLAGLEDVTSGRIRIDDRDVTDVPPGQRDVAMVFQDYGLYPHMTVRENLSLGLRIRKIAQQEIDRRVKWSAGVLGLEQLLDRKPKQLSGGQRQRVAMGRAMVREPSVFLFDEPLSNLDAALRAQMRIEIGSLQRRLKTTTVYVTHDQVEAMTLGDRIVVLADGRIQQIGRPIDLYENPVNRFVAGFIGTPSMNFLPGVLHNEGGRTYFTTDGARISLRGSPDNGAVGVPVTMGIRPEDLAIESDADRMATNSNENATTTNQDKIHAGHSAIHGKVVLVERLGGTSHIHFEVGQHRLLASVANQALPDVGDEIAVHVPESRAHLFSADGTALARA